MSTGHGCTPSRLQAARWGLRCSAQPVTPGVPSPSPVGGVDALPVWGAEGPCWLWRLTVAPFSCACLVLLYSGRSRILHVSQSSPNPFLLQAGKPFSCGWRTAVAGSYGPAPVAGGEGSAPAPQPRVLAILACQRLSPQVRCFCGTELGHLLTAVME